MTAPIRVGEDPLDALLALKKQRGAPSAPDPLDELMATKTGDPNQKLHDEYKVGNLARRMASENATDVAEANDDTEPTKVGAALRAFMAAGAGAAQVIPGMEFLQSGARALVRRQPFAEARADIKRDVEKIPTGTRILGKALAAPALGPLLSSSPAIAGAQLGGADQALSADPVNTMGDLGWRGVKTAAGAGIGALIGKGSEKLATAVKARLTPTPEDNIIARQAARAASAKKLFGAASSEAEKNEVTPAIRSYLAEPDIAARVEALQRLDQFKHTPVESFEMLDALHKSLSDEAHQIGKGLAQLDPSKPNTGRFLGQHVRSLKDRLVSALEAPGTKTIPAPATAQSPPPDIRTALRAFQARPGIAAARREGTVAQQMARQALERHEAETVVSPALRGSPSETVVETAPFSPGYRTATRDFAKRSADIEALGKGMNAMQGKERPSFKAILNKNTKTPATFREWARSASPSELDAAREGILGDTRNAFGLPGWRLKAGRQAAGKASGLLRDIDPHENEQLIRLLGLANAPMANR